MTDYSPFITDIMEDMMDSPEEEVTAQARHSDAEVIAQAICTTLNSNLKRWVYAVGRRCSGTNSDSCSDICESPKLSRQDPKAAHLRWGAFAALRVFKNRPSTSHGTADNPRLGLKAYRYRNINSVGCGPNFCCCYATV